MTISLPSDAVGQIGSSTTSSLVSFAGPAEIIGGVLLAFLVLTLILNSFHSAPTQGSAQP